jgi:hypothetical protein
VDDGERAGVVDILERGERGMEAEKAVEVEDRASTRPRFKHALRRAAVVVVRAFAVGHDRAQAVDCAAQEDGDQHITASSLILLGAKGEARHPRGKERGTDAKYACLRKLGEEVASGWHRRVS